MDEKVFLEAGTVKVTNTRFVVGSQTYAMTSVNSVKTTKNDISPSNAAAGWMVAIGGVWLLIHIINQSMDITGYLLPMGILATGIWWIWNSKEKYEYKLILTTSSGETPVLVSQRAEDIVPVEKALTDAIIYRG